MTDPEERRPNPEAILERIRKEERGKLTIFLGAMAGVGKTYAMLQTARERAAEGADVVIGWIDTHGREETEKLAEGLPRIPPLTVEYKGKTFSEMDLDAILARKPQIVLVDELAHTNIGTRHARRFQDVEEILAAGIDVYTTLNIQHIESLGDLVSSITGIVVRETVPDAFIESADEIRLVDTPPPELLKRLQEGKIYIPDMAERARRHFFRPGNINALRELALRYTARHVDLDLRLYMQEHGIEGPWPAGERVMVCVGPSPFSAHLIRVARRLATGLKAEWIAANVITSQYARMSERDRHRLARNMRLAVELGAETVTVAGNDIAEQIIRIAKEHNVSSIVIGKPSQKKLSTLLKRTAVDRLLHSGEELNIYVVQGKMGKASPSGFVTTHSDEGKIPWRFYLYAAFVALILTGLGWFFAPFPPLAPMAILYTAGIAFSAIRWGRYPAYLTALLQAFFLDFFFIEPPFSFESSDPASLWSLFLLLASAVVVGESAQKLRKELYLSRRLERHTRALFNFSREIAAVIDPDVIAQALARQVCKAMGKPIIVLLPDENQNLIVKGFSAPEGDERNHGAFVLGAPLPNPSEAAVATWAFQHGEPAGRTTETLPGGEILYLPLVSGGTTMGLLGILLEETILTPEQHSLIEAWVGLAALSVERVRLAQKTREAQLLAESEQLRSALLDSISHELRTPLASIFGATSALLESEELFSPEDRRELLLQIQDGASRMEKLINNLLDSARLESGVLSLREDWCDIEDIIGSALRKMGPRLKGRPIRTSIEPNLPLFRADCVLVEHVLTNLIDNAIKYSDEFSPVELSARREGNRLLVSVADRGMGIPPDERPHLFEKFFRGAQGHSLPGTGLGLSICKGIIEAHGGRIWVDQRPGGGTVVSFELPLETEEKNHD